MFFRAFILLLPFVWANQADYVKVAGNINRIDRRLRTIEDNIAEERIQRREDVHSVLNKLVELQNTIQGSQQTQKEENNEMDAENRAQIFIGQITHAFSQEKQTNLRFRREIQDKLKELSPDILDRLDSFDRQLNIIVKKTDLSTLGGDIIGETRKASTELSKQLTDSVIRLPFVETQLSNVVTLVEKLNENTLKSENIVTKVDLSTMGNEIMRELRQVSADIENFAKLVDNTNETSRHLTENLDEIKQMMASTKGTCQNTDDKLEKFRRLGVTTLTTNLNTPADAACLANLVDKSKAEFSSCLDLKYAGYTKDGVYKIKVKGRYLQVYCDQTTDGGGWIVFQRRKDGSVDFYRTWNSYKHGFGDLQSEFWLGNDNLADLTESCCHELRIDLGDVDGSTAYAKYNEFRVLDEGSLYELNIGTYSGNAGDSLKQHDKMKFSTRDSDNDEYEDNCADIWNEAWWFKRCYFSHLNGVFNVDGFVEDNYNRISWSSCKNKRDKGGYHSLTFSEMKFR